MRAVFSRLLLCLTACLCTLQGQAAALDTDAQQHLRAATFEVVQLKPPEGSVEYERALPLDLVPYQERTDKYRSIGTAFAIGANRYVTAGHVLDLGAGSQFGPPALRDAGGNVYAIDQVIKYDARRDFVEFSLREQPKQPQLLELGAKPAINDVVYAVGNALGEGVVIRDGVYTSDTPEEMDGQWKWLRFSAAASPGNSGGPLVDASGKVIGVVLRKSESENLNYALPIEEVVSNKEGDGAYVMRLPLRVPLMDVSETSQISEHIALPKSLPEFYAATLAITLKVVIGGQRTLLLHNVDQCSPNGSGSERALATVERSPLPRILLRDKDGNWIVSGAPNADTGELDDNGFVQLGGSDLRLRLPDHVTLASVNADSKQLMDLILKGYTLKRPLGSDSVRVTSLGKAQEESTFTDRYGRVWLWKTWNVPFSDSFVYGCLMAVPGGYVGVFSAARSGFSALVHQEQQLMVDYVFVTFEGTLNQWQDYLKVKGVQPKIFESLKFDINLGQSLQIRSKRLELALTPELLPLSKDTILDLNFAFYRDGKDVVWDLGGLSLWDGAHDGNGVGVYRAVMPPASLPDDARHNWANLKAHDYPYNSQGFKVEGGTRIRTDIAPAGDEDSPLRYALTVSREGDQPQDVMADRLTKLQTAFKIAER